MFCVLSDAPPEHASECSISRAAITGDNKNVIGKRGNRLLRPSSRLVKNEKVLIGGILPWGLCVSVPMLNHERLL
ncbi:hypothetical protein SAMN05444273_108150 [Litoreibacter ascidiaceicola]|uniref:Uncharacterized protein n=1 Tax=Litoreibacter ascidiaceicola TaxID=1486859 RepID=A0A1M5D9E3_9RHOB|nr:hypothetical protein SAMN05444273_108150 [Litoreibacter ascidiaceicola]